MKFAPQFKIGMLFISLVCLVFCWSYFYQAGGMLFLVKDHQIITLHLKTHFFSPSKKQLRVEVVKMPASKMQGLSARKSMLDQAGRAIDGMLFVFANKQRQSFWMKDMLFDLDICWLKDNQFLACQRQATAQEPQIIYHSPSPSNLVLETLPGKLTELDLQTKLFFRFN